MMIASPVTIASVRAHGVRQSLVFCRQTPAGQSLILIWIA